MTDFRKQVESRLRKEQGTLYGSGSRQVALVYPSPYSVAMSSLGFQSVYGLLNGLPDTVAERAFLPDEGSTDEETLRTYEGSRPVGDFPLVAFSVAYELELTGFFKCLQLSGIPILRTERDNSHPIVIAGGPLTFSNPLPLSPFVDALVMGEAEDILPQLIDELFLAANREELWERLAAIEGIFVPEREGDILPPVARADDSCLPAHSVITTPDTVLSNMFLVEPERGCSRGCSFCVMRRGPNAGMRVIAKERVLAAIPDTAQRVGLVGAAVTDHPRILDIVKGIVEGGKEVSLASMRADRLTPEFVYWLQRGGYKTLTVASDGASERLRIALEKKIRAKHLLHTAKLASENKMKALKVYMMIGVPDEEQADLDELIAFTLEMAQVTKPGKLALGIAPFVAKRNTPLDGAAFVGIKEIEQKLRYLRKGFATKAGERVELRAVSARWAWVEYQLAQGGCDAGLAALQAFRAGGRFQHWKKAFQERAVSSTISTARSLPKPKPKRSRLPLLPTG